MNRFALAVVLIASAARAEETVEHTRKNIRVLQGLPESQLFMAMNSVARSLGVHCDYCHVRKSEYVWVWEIDEKRPKLVAREMIKMTRAITPAVSCYTCHRGKVAVERVPPLPPHDPALDPVRAPVALPTAAEIVKRYIAAVGSATFAPLSVEMDVARSQGRKAHVTLDIAAPDKVDFTLTTTEGVIRQGLDGTSAWRDLGKGEGPKPLPAETVNDLRRAAAIYHVMKVPEAPEEMRVTGVEQIGNRDAYTVAVRNKTYFFDVGSGLLVRALTVNETLLAPLPEQVEYDDYRTVDGVKVPFLIRTYDVAPFDTAVRTVTAIRLRK